MRKQKIMGASVPGREKEISWHDASEEGFGKRAFRYGADAPVMRDPVGNPVKGKVIKHGFFGLGHMRLRSFPIRRTGSVSAVSQILDMILSP